MIAINVTQMLQPSHSDVGYMATCSECGRRKRLMRNLAKYYVSPEAKGWVWVLACKCGETCIVDVSAQQAAAQPTAQGVGKNPESKVSRGG